MPIISPGGGGSSGAISGVTVSGTAASGQVPVASSSSAGAWGYPPGFEINYTQATATVNIGSTTEATGTTILSPGAITFDGTAVLVTFFSPDVRLPSAAAGNNVIVSLFESATQITRLAVVITPSVTAQGGVPICAQYRFTPTAAAHTYTVTAVASSLTGTPSVGAGAGGTATDAPMFVRFQKA